MVSPRCRPSSSVSEGGRRHGAKAGITDGDSVQVHPREVFRAAIIGAAHAVIVMHNHPSGDPTPSFADLRVTRDLQQAGNLLKIEVLDHIIIGNPKFTSLKQLGQI